MKTLQRMFVEAANAHPGQRNLSVERDGVTVYAFYSMNVPVSGVVHGEILRCKPALKQGFDLRCKPGLETLDGRTHAILRTWDEPSLARRVAYPYDSTDGIVTTNNVYMMQYPREAVEERSTGNAGMLVLDVGDCEWEFRCSPGSAAVPDFDAIVFRLRFAPGRTSMTS